MKGTGLEAPGQRNVDQNVVFSVSVSLGGQSI